MWVTVLRTFIGALLTGSIRDAARKATIQLASEGAKALVTMLFNRWAAKHFPQEVRTARARTTNDQDVTAHLLEKLSQYMADQGATQEWVADLTFIPDSFHQFVPPSIEEAAAASASSEDKAAAAVATALFPETPTSRTATHAKHRL